MNGQYTLQTILKYLAYQKQSTCEEIAKAEYEKNLQSQIKLKSITDDVRKFIKNNLIWTRLVREDGYKKVYNKQVKAYSLTPVGILYAIYLFSNLSIDKWGASWVHGGATQADLDLLYEETGKDFVYDTQLPIDFILIRSLAEQYSETLPKVFGRFKLFEKIIGEEFEMTVINPFIQLFFPREPTIPDITEMLTEYAMYAFYSRDLTKNGPDDLIAEQLSLVFYANLESSIEQILDSRNFNEWSKKAHNNENVKNDTNAYKQNLQIAKQKWMEILDEDKKIKKWYYNFIKKAIRSKGAEFANLNWYRKNVFSSIT